MKAADQLARYCGLMHSFGLSIAGIGQNPLLTVAIADRQNLEHFDLHFHIEMAHSGFVFLVLLLVPRQDLVGFRS